MTIFTLLEFFGMITALAYVYLAAKGNVWCFLFGFISSLIYVYISLQAKYYFDSFINAYYIVMSVYGWINWKSRKSGDELPVSKMGSRQFISTVMFGLLATGVFGYLSQEYTDASLPYIDGFTTVFALIATWMVVKKQVENWLIWIVVDFTGVGMYWWKELYITSALFLIYTVIAIIAYFEWKKKIRQPS